MRYHERMIMLSVLDTQWKDHLLNMDHLKEGIGLRGYGQHDPLVEYKRESFDMFEEMMAKAQQDAVRYLFHMQIMDAPAAQAAVGVTNEWRPAAATVAAAEEARFNINGRPGSAVSASQEKRAGTGAHGGIKRQHVATTGGARAGEGRKE